MWILHSIALAIGLGLGFVVTPTAIVPQPVPDCMLRTALIGQLQLRYREAPVAHGIVSRKMIAELFESENGETWTIVGTTSTGLSCMVASGRYWTRTAWKPPEKKS